ncbi:MAG: helix-turn-helix transcriptional regulator [Bacteriovoracaceae bacterium]
MDKKGELKKLGRNIAKWRSKRGISQDDLAYESEVGRRTINRIEVGDTDARYSTLLKIAKILEIRVKDLVDY